MGAHAILLVLSRCGSFLLLLVYIFSDINSHYSGSLSLPHCRHIVIYYYFFFSGCLDLNTDHVFFCASSIVVVFVSGFRHINKRVNETK